MCGIAGYVGPDCGRVRRVIEAMNGAMAHRGRDDEGVNCYALPDNRWLGLGHRRLAILDLSAAGHQPMSDATTGNVIVFNGEIYNFRTLRTVLQAKGHSFASQTDTEVLLKGYAEWGLEIFDKLEGMYAAALYDAAAQKLCLARDPLGIKPLYVSSGRGVIQFASELRALVQPGGVPRRLDRRALAGFLAYGSVQEPLTICEQVRMVPPGTLWLFDLASPAPGPEPRSFWSFPVPAAAPLCSRPEAVVQIRELLDRAMRRHLMGDVPVGIFLSGGLDSAVVAGFSARQPVCDLRTYTVALPGHGAMDESRQAAEIARAVGSSHQSIHLTAADVEHYARQWFAAMDQPGIDGLNTYIVAGAAAGCGIKVALSGLGGDELFGGYPHFASLPRQHRLLQALALLPPAWRIRAVRALLAGQPETVKRKAEDLAGIQPDSIFALALTRRRLFSNRELQELGLDRAALELDEFWVDGRCGALAQLPPSAERDIHGAIGTAESLFYMRNTLLRDADVMGMAHGMELRLPLLDQPLVDFVAALPGRWRVRRDGRNKPLLADAAAPVVDAARIARRRKQGFSLPHASWIRGTLRADLAGKLEMLKASGWLEGDRIETIWRRFQEQSSDAGWSRVWALAVLGHLAGSMRP